MSAQERYRCVIMRGGTSKAIFLNRNDLPKDPALRDRLILAIFGSPDVRQIDGLGGADLLTSKVAIIGPPTRPDADVDYTFGQVGITRARVDYAGNCGNISSAVGPYAIYQGLVEPKEPVTTVRIHLTNTRRLIVAQVPVKDGQPEVEGDYQIDGCPGTGAEIALDMSGTAGAATGKILPTGNATDTIRVDGVGDLRVSLVDAGNPVAFMKAQDIGLQATESPAEIESTPGLLETIERIRSVAAQKMGFVRDWRLATEQSQFLPLIAIVNAPHAYTDYTTGKPIEADAIDMLSRLLYNQRMHKTYPITGTVCTGAAACIPGTVVHEVVSGAAVQKGKIRVGHPAGVISIEASVRMDGGEPVLTRAAIGRTARMILEGYVFARKAVLSAA
jgi:2-methylaconitate cis-trans-isomerase PrpF